MLSYLAWFHHLQACSVAALVDLLALDTPHPLAPVPIQLWWCRLSLNILFNPAGMYM